jgi:hypothetical protein
MSLRRIDEATPKIRIADEWEYELSATPEEAVEMPRTQKSAAATGAWRMRRKAPDGIEPSDGGFADLCLTTWLRRRRREM